jgi:hypothetical protein
MGKPLAAIGMATGILSKPKSQEQPQVAAQMNSPQPTSAPTGPTAAEMEQQRLLNAKRRGRKATILTSGTGVSDTTTLGYTSILG